MVQYLANSKFYFEIDGVTSLTLKSISGLKLNWKLRGAIQLLESPKMLKPRLKRRLVELNTTAPLPSPMLQAMRENKRSFRIGTTIVTQIPFLGEAPKRWKAVKRDL